MSFMLWISIFDLESELHNMIGMNFYSVDKFQRKYEQQNDIIILGNMEKNTWIP